eukprot:GFYU01001055.1.p1 GENE.GFYU01001055.1~~GFYU01001055.1.p1  ORF type:complete len:612 (-),score=131.51 GFYU01001055.1:125-1960(-)
MVHISMGKQITEVHDTLVLDVEIKNYDIVHKEQQKYTVYCVQVRSKKCGWFVLRRFREFEDLHRRLRNTHQQLPDCPAKKAFGNLRPEFVEKRAQDLQEFMLAIVQSPLLWDPDVAAFLELNQLKRAAYAGDSNFVYHLLNHGAPADDVDGFGCSALHYSVAQGREDVVALLAEGGADINVIDKYGHTARQIASARQDQGKMCEVLDYYGACVTPYCPIGTLPVPYLNMNPRCRRYLVIVNPHAGKKKSSVIFEQEVSPLLRLAGCSLTVHEMKSPESVRKVIAKINLQLCDGVLCVGGDTLIHNVTDALLSRQDGDSAIRVPIGIIPTGSTNVMAKALGITDVDDAVKRIIRGRACPTDVLKVSQVGKTVYCVMSMFWAMVNCRKNYAAGITAISKLRPVRGRLSFLPVQEDLSSSVWPQCTGPVCAQCNVSTNAQPKPAPLVSNGNGYHRPGGYGGQANGAVVPPPAMVRSGVDNNHLSMVPTSPTPSLIRRRSSSLKWRVLEGQFAFVMAVNTPYILPDMKAAPLAHLCDGCVDLVVVRNCTKAEILSIIPLLENGQHVDSPLVEYHKASQFFLEPLCTHSGFDLDAQAANPLPVKCEVISGLVTMIA